MIETNREVEIPAGLVSLPGMFTVPVDAAGVVLFAHGSSTSRFNPRNRVVAEMLHQAGIGTLLFDLPSEGEERDRRYVLNIELLAERLDAARCRVAGEVGESMPLGYFGTSTGSAAALAADAAHPGSVQAIVSRGGRPDLAGEALSRVTAPTLLIVGGADRATLEQNRSALRRLPAPRKLAVVSGATHLFEEPGALEQVVRLARDWFTVEFAAAAAHVPA